MTPANPEHTPIQRFRLDQELWEEFGERAGKVGTNRSKLLGQFVRWYLQEPRSQLPIRPKRRPHGGGQGPEAPPAND